MIISNIQLDLDLSDFIEHLRVCGLQSDYALFLSLYRFGFRIEEMKQCHTWTITANNQIECTCSKKSQNRFSPISQAPALLIRSIETGQNHIYISSYSSYKRLFYTKVLGGGYCINKKRIATHVFRHLKMKKMHDAGATYAQISSYFGLNSTFIVMNYVHSQIQYYCPPIGSNSN